MPDQKLERARRDRIRKGKSLEKANRQMQQAVRDRRSRVVIARRRRIVKRAQKRLAKADRVYNRQKARVHAPLRIKAYREAMSLVGVMEHGGNNRGTAVERIIREGGGIPGQAWCGWFVATCYRRAGSRAVEWRWGAVRLLSSVTGVRRTSTPQKGDLVRFTFDHVGMFIKDNGDGTIQSVEGNSGASGAVSDSSTGGDGVYIKNRPKSLVRDYLKVTK